MVQKNIDLLGAMPSPLVLITNGNQLPFGLATGSSTLMRTFAPLQGWYSQGAHTATTPSLVEIMGLHL